MWSLQFRDTIDGVKVAFLTYENIIEKIVFYVHDKAPPVAVPFSIIMLLQVSIFEKFRKITKMSYFE